MSGHGKQTFPLGDIYEGEFSNNSRHGYGVYMWSDGAKYFGDFVNNHRFLLLFNFSAYHYHFS